MPAMQPQWRQRRQAIGRKGYLEAEMVFESEALVVTNGKPGLTVPSSPVQVTDALFDDMPEIKPIVLPDAWITVGKGGKPLPLRGEAQKMYDEPQKKKKKKKKARKAKATDEAADPLAAYEEMPSSSSDCLAAHSRSMAKHEKAVERKHQAKHWAKYRQEKGMKMMALDELMALGAFGDLEGAPSASQQAPSKVKPWQLNRNDRAERTRRKVRLARAAERCYFEPEEVINPRDAVVAEAVSSREMKKGAAASPAAEKKNGAVAPAAKGKGTPPKAERARWGSAKKVKAEGPSDEAKAKKARRKSSSKGTCLVM